MARVASDGRGSQSSAFRFASPRGTIDWTFIRTLDVDSLVSSPRLDVLERALSSLVEGDLEAVDIRSLSPAAFIRVFRVSQLGMQYLLYVQNRLSSKLARYKSLAREIGAAKHKADHAVAEHKRKSEALQNRADVLAARLQEAHSFQKNESNRLQHLIERMLSCQEDLSRRLQKREDSLLKLRSEECKTQRRALQAAVQACGDAETAVRSAAAKLVRGGSRLEEQAAGAEKAVAHLDRHIAALRGDVSGLGADLKESALRAQQRAQRGESSQVQRLMAKIARLREERTALRRECEEQRSAAAELSRRAQHAAWAERDLRHALSKPAVGSKHCPGCRARLGRLPSPSDSASLTPLSDLTLGSAASAERAASPWEESWALPAAKARPSSWGSPLLLVPAPGARVADKIRAPRAARVRASEASPSHRRAARPRSGGFYKPLQEGADLLERGRRGRGGTGEASRSPSPVVCASATQTRSATRLAEKEGAAEGERARLPSDGASEGPRERRASRHAHFASSSGSPPGFQRSLEGAENSAVEDVYPLVRPRQAVSPDWQTDGLSPELGTSPSSPPRSPEGLDAASPDSSPVLAGPRGERSWAWSRRRGARRLDEASEDEE